MRENLPLSKPGFYGLYDLVSDKWYIGVTNNMAERARVHGRTNHAWESNLPRLKAAMDAVGASSFVFIPLYYSRVKLGRMADAGLIHAFDSCNNGYNLYEKSSDAMRTVTANAARGTTLRSERLRAIRKAQNAKPEQIAAMQAGLTPEVIARRGKSIAKAYQNKETKDRLKQSMEQARNKPGVKERHRAGVKAAWAARREKYGPSGRP